jgi:hypothetical protein
LGREKTPVNYSEVVKTKAFEVATRNRGNDGKTALGNKLEKNILRSLRAPLQFTITLAQSLTMLLEKYINPVPV